MPAGRDARRTGRNSECVFVSIVLGLALLAAAGAGSDDNVVGVWANPHDSLRVRTYRCGDQLCGTIVKASARQIEKAKRPG